MPHRLALLLQLAVVVEPRTPPPPRCARFSIRAAGQAFLAPTLAVTLAFSDGTAALAEQPLQEQPSGAAVARMITADEITSSELVSALGRGAAEAAEAARLAGGALEGVAGESQAAFAGGGSLSRVIAGKLIPALTSSALTAADELQVPRQRQPSLAPLSAQPSALSPSALQPLSPPSETGTNRAQFALLDGVDALRASPQLQAARQQAQRELALRTAAAEQVGSGSG
jgi:hypothetical protein